MRIDLYQSVKDVATIPLQVTFYCEEKHISWSDAYGYWIDTAYTYKADDQSTKHVPRYGPLSKDSSKKPGARGSYTSLGESSVALLGWLQVSYFR